MRILNWVHRKFHHNVDGYTVSPKKDDFTFNVNKSETVISATDTKVLLDPVTYMDVWKDGMLTIGTLGYEYSVDDEEEQPAEEEYFVANERQLNPLDVKTSNPKLEIITDAAVITPDIKVFIEETPDTAPLLPEITAVKRRITLGDLLSVAPEVDVEKVLESRKISMDLGMKSADTQKKKSILSFGKNPGEEKEKKEKKEKDSRPKRKLQRMISKMLKKKIYPEIPGKDGLNDAMNKTMDSLESKLLKLRSNGGNIEMI